MSTPLADAVAKKFNKAQYIEMAKQDSCLAGAPLPQDGIDLYASVFNDDKEAITCAVVQQRVDDGLDKFEQVTKLLEAENLKFNFNDKDYQAADSAGDTLNDELSKASSDDDAVRLKAAGQAMDGLTDKSLTALASMSEDDLAKLITQSSGK